eukprot:TRINITY_DN11790_c1_g1_i1.p2 TRINITY_DN11790_c1_g1~~TRINITY_DN11790_c1_g1_i1.p2  ORF type:complete len:205 (-),score=-2.89 TRINITY_DN11790_c1_g1_i1:686-1261(-)
MNGSYSQSSQIYTVVTTQTLCDIVLCRFQVFQLQFVYSTQCQQQRHLAVYIFDAMSIFTTVNVCFTNIVSFLATHLFVYFNTMLQLQEFSVKQQQDSVDNFNNKSQTKQHCVLISDTFCCLLQHSVTPTNIFSVIVKTLCCFVQPQAKTKFKERKVLLTMCLNQQMSLVKNNNIVLFLETLHSRYKRHSVV